MSASVHAGIHTPQADTPPGQTPPPPPADGYCCGWYASYWNVFLLPPANEVWGKVIFLHLFVILFTGGEYLTRYTPQGPGTSPQNQVHPLGPGTPPRDQVHPPGTGYTPLWDQVHPPGTRYPPGLIQIFRWFKFTLKPPYSIAIGKLRLAIWDTSFWTFWLKFGHKGP